MSAYTTLRITREDTIQAITSKILEANNEQLESICEKLEVAGTLYNYLITNEYEYRRDEMNFREKY